MGSSAGWLSGRFTFSSFALHALWLRIYFAYTLRVDAMNDALEDRWPG
jgi:hypothetical protein